MPVPCFIYKVLKQVSRGEGRGMSMCAKSDGEDKCATPHKLLQGRGKEWIIHPTQGQLILGLEEELALLPLEARLS